MTHLTVRAAYGRSYKNIPSIRADWDAGKDFRIATLGPNDGRYINKQDADRGGVTINVRYNNDRSVTVIKPQAN